MPYKSEFPSIQITDRPFTDIILEQIRRHAADPTKVAFVHAHDQKEVVTFAQLYDRIQRLAGFLKQRNFGQGDVAGIVTQNCWQFAAAFIAVGLRGGALSGASYLFTSFEIQQQFNDCKTKVVFCSTDVLKATREAVQRTPSVTTLVIITDSRENVDLLPNEFLFDRVLETAPLDSNNLKCDPAKQLLLVPYSSGTTGEPKGVLISHQNLTAMIEMYIAYYKVHIWPKIDENLRISEENLVVMLPCYHLYGLFLIAQSMWNGMTCVLMKKFDGELFCKCIEQFRVRIQYLVPPIVLFLAKSPLIEKYDLSSLRFILAGAAPLGGEVCLEVQRRIPTLKFIVQGYGMTETCVASHFPVLQEPPNSSTVGKLAPNMEEKIVDVLSKKELPRGHTGEICVKGPNVMLGYLNRPKATAETVDKDGWLFTGDIGYLDNNGCLYIVDRLKELIKVKGLQVAPAEIEAILLLHPEINDCAVIGIPDERTGERPKAYVVRKSNNLTAENIHQFLKGKVAEYKQLKEVQFVDTIPKSPSGKILRRELRDNLRHKI